MNTVQQAADAGRAQMALAFDAEQARDDSFGERAARFLRAYLTLQAEPGRPFSAETVTLQAAAVGIEPRDGRAWGQIFRNAQRAGLIRRSGTMIRRARGHGAFGPAWERA